MKVQYISTIQIIHFHAPERLHAARAFLRLYGASGQVGPKSSPGAALRRLRFGHSSTNNRNGGQYGYYQFAGLLPIQKLKPIIRSAAAYAPPEVVDGKPPVYPYTPIKSDFEDAETVEEMMLYTELQSAVHAMIQRLEYSFTFNPNLLTSPKRKKQVAEILTEAEKYIWRIKEEMRCA